jgi:ABC-type multidrug transport system ATPase subunit
VGQDDDRPDPATETPSHPGASSPSAKASGLPILPALLAGRYRIGALLGEGGFARVFEARDDVLDRVVALKVLHPRSASGHPRAAQRFLDEARIVARLDHPNVVPVYDAGLLDGTPWMVMRIVRGQSLAVLLRERGAMGRVRAVEVLRQALQALGHAHRRGLVHRDVKPANLIVEPREDGGDHIWLADFGLARSLGAGEGREAVVRGTPVYTAPEQITGRRVDHRADLFAMGCIACELITGERCFEGDTFSEILRKVVHELPRGLDALDALAGAPYAAVVRRALAKSPADRHASAEAMRLALEATKGSEGSRPPARRGLQALFAPRTDAPWDGRHVLEARSLSKRFGRRATALRDVDLDVPAGAIFCLLGSNGAGKTTLLRIALGLYTQDRGTIRVFGRDPRRQRTAVLSRIGYVPEVPAAHEFLRVQEVLALVRAARPTWDQAYAYRLLARFELPLDVRVRALSRGLKTKLSLVSALAPRPEFLVLDDPTIGLDVVVLQDFFDTLREASSREGVSVLLSSHNVDDVERIATHVAFLREGGLLLAGRLDDLRRRTRRVELRFRDETPTLSFLAGFKTLQASGRQVSGLVLDAFSGTLEALRAMDPEAMEVEEPSLKETFIALMREPPPS